MDVRGSHGREGGLTEDREEVPETLGQGACLKSSTHPVCSVESWKTSEQNQTGIQSHLTSEGEPVCSSNRANFRPVLVPASPEPPLVLFPRTFWTSVAQRPCSTTQPGSGHLSRPSPVLRVLRTSATPVINCEWGAITKPKAHF